MEGGGGEVERGRRGEQLCKPQESEVCYILNYYNNVTNTDYRRGNGCPVNFIECPHEVAGELVWPHEVN